MEPEVSIILLTKNGQRYLGEVLDGIFRQSSQYSYEVVLIDSGSTDGTWTTARSFPIHTHRISPREFNHGETRNQGARLACPSAEYLVYLTQDATPLEDWLDSLLDPLRTDRQVAGAFSRHVPRPTCTPSMARLLRTQWEQTGTPDRVVKRITDLDDYKRNQAYFAHFSNTSSAIRRAVWEKHPFMPMDFAEDSEWADRVLRAGYTLVYEPSSRVLHSHDYSLWQQFAQNVDHAFAMKQIHHPPEYEDTKPARAFLRVLDQIRRDWQYISGTEAHGTRRTHWYLYAPFWQIATEAGAYIGSRADRLPPWLHKRLSRQAQLRG